MSGSQSEVPVFTPLELETLAEQIAVRVADRLVNRRRLLTRHELSGVIGVSVPKLDRMLKNDELPIIRAGRKVLFDPDEVISHLARKSRAIGPAG